MRGFPEENNLILWGRNAGTGGSGPTLSQQPGYRRPGAARSMCNSLPPRASHLRPQDDAASVVECLRPRGEHDYSIFLTLTPLSGPQEGPRRSQPQPNTTPTPPSAFTSWRQMKRPTATQAGKERPHHGR